MFQAEVDLSLADLPAMSASCTENNKVAMCFRCFGYRCVDPQSAECLQGGQLLCRVVQVHSDQHLLYEAPKGWGMLVTKVYPSLS